MGSGLFDLSGRVALVTGSGRGIGLALARGLAGHGATVVLNARTAAALAAPREALRAEGHAVHAAAFDVTDPAAVTDAVAAIEAAAGPVDILVNNAGVQFRGPLETYPEEQWQRLMAINVGGAFHVAKAVVPGMIARRRGKIVNIASVQSEMARPGVTPYAATKGALRNLTRGMCAEWARHGIQANAIAPGYFRTELNRELFENRQFSGWLETRTPAGRWGDVGELVGAAVFLASDASSFVNGHTLFVDGGITVAL